VASLCNCTLRNEVSAQQDTASSFACASCDYLNVIRIFVSAHARTYGPSARRLGRNSATRERRKPQEGTPPNARQAEAE